MRATILTVILVFAGLLAAHLEGEKIAAGGKFIEIAILPEKPTAGNTTVLVFAMEDSKGRRLAFNSLFVRISQADRVLFATPDLAPDFAQVAQMSYTFASAGEHEVDMEFDLDGRKYSGKKTIAVAGEKEQNQFFLPFIGAAIAIGYVFAIWAARNSKKITK